MTATTENESREQQNSVYQRVQKNGIFECGCDKKLDFCTRNVQVFGVQENGFLALRVKENWGCKKTVTHELYHSKAREKLILQ